MNPDAEDLGEQTVGLQFREAMSRLACGVVIVTTVVDGVPWGMTVSACCSVSMDPPLLLVSLAGQTKSAVTIRERGRFGVSILGADSVEVARFGSAPGQPKFIPHFCGPDEEHPVASPNVVGALAHADCTLESEVPAGDHVLFIGRVGRVRGVDAPATALPLVYYQREYHAVSGLQDALR
jgi:flavin reductase (DIM6/NTAB) family NADH-FMN oxidoreductase RutF